MVARNIGKEEKRREGRNGWIAFGLLILVLLVPFVASVAIGLLVSLYATAVMTAYAALAAWILPGFMFPGFAAIWLAIWQHVTFIVTIVAYIAYWLYVLNEGFKDEFMSTYG